MTTGFEKIKEPVEEGTSIFHTKSSRRVRFREPVSLLILINNVTNSSLNARKPFAPP